MIALCAQTEVSDTDYALYLDSIVGALADGVRTGNRRCVLFDVSKGGSTDAARRKKLSQLLVRHRADIARAFSACAFASSSPIARGIATAIMWMAPPPIPTKFVASAREAFEWLAAYAPAVQPLRTLTRYEALKRDYFK